MGFSFTGIILVVVLAITGGAIAFIGDRLGLKVGKRRLSIFGLRPKYTSVLVAVFTGMIITITTVGLLSAVSLEVRTALFGIKELKLTLATQKQELAAKEKNLNELSLLIAQTEKDLEEIDKQRLAALKELNETDLKLEQLNEDYKEVNLRLTDADKMLEEKTAELKQAEARVDVLKEVEKRLTKTIEETTKAKETTEESLGRLYGGYILYQAGEIIYNKVVEGDAKSIEAQLYEAMQIADSLAYQKGARSNEKGFRALRILGDDIDSLETLAGAASKNEGGVFRVVAFGNTVIGDPLACYFEYLPRQKIYNQGDVLAETVLESDFDPQSVFEAIALMLTDLNFVARQRGMLVGENGKVVEVPVKVLQAAIDQVSEHGKAVKITALAVQDVITTEFPIYCDLEVRALP